MNEKTVEKEIVTRRRKNFKAYVKKDRDGTHLCITHNGYQYQSIDLNEEEMAKVIEVLQAELSPAF